MALVMRMLAPRDLRARAQEGARDYWTVLENLTAFVRERTLRAEAEQMARPLDQRRAELAYSLWESAGRPEGRSEEFWGRAVAEERPAADVAAVLTVIGRRRAKYREFEGRLDFRRAILRQANLRRAHLEGALLDFAHLDGAFLEGT